MDETFPNKMLYKIILFKAKADTFKLLLNPFVIYCTQTVTSNFTTHLIFQALDIKEKI